MAGDDAAAAVAACEAGVAAIAVSEKVQQEAPKKEKRVKKPHIEQLTEEYCAVVGFAAERLDKFITLKAKQDAYIASKAAEARAISVTVEDKVYDCVAYVDTPMRIAKLHYVDGAANKDAAKEGKKRLGAFVAARVDGLMWDLQRPLEGHVKTLEYFTFEDEEGLEVFRHSSSHILGACLERVYGAVLSSGPPCREGFYYDCGLPELVERPDGSDASGPHGACIADRKVTEDGIVPIDVTRSVAGDHLKGIEKTAERMIAKWGFDFERLEVSKEELLDLFSYNQLKCENLAAKIPDGARSTIYRCGPFMDPCRGPHLTSTKHVGALHVTKNSSAYYKADATRDLLQRVYGISFPSKKELADWKFRMAEAAKRDHRKIGAAQSLFFFDPISPGSAFWLPHGARIYDRLLNRMRDMYWRRGYDVVVTPNTYNKSLWETSGHWGKYRDNMFQFDCESQQFGIKPMNCPGHCVLYKHVKHSYRDLPLRYAEFGVLHRNELSGALVGLTRVRRFIQDDAHVFCREDQVEDEISSFLEFLEEVYGWFGFKFVLKFSTKPTCAIGSDAVWEKAETALQQALDKSGVEYGINPGDGAFYGPKLDVELTDCIGRSHQCGTLQVDFNLPERFDLRYAGADEQASAKRAAADTEGKAGEGGDKDASSGVNRPVMIHRAIYGSFERFIAILIEHCAGKWPMWLSPRQVAIINVPYAKRDRGRC